MNFSDDVNTPDDDSGKVTPPNGPAGKDGADGQDGADGNDFLVDDKHELEEQADKALEDIPKSEALSEFRKAQTDAKEAADELAKDRDSHEKKEKAEAAENKLIEARKALVESLKHVEPKTPEVDEAIEKNEQLIARHEFDANIRFREEEEKAKEAQEKEEEEKEEAEKEFEEKLEPWAETIEEMNFWTTVVEARLLGVEILLEKLNAEIVTVENKVTATAEKITRLTDSASRTSDEWQAVKTKLNAQRAALEQRAENTKDHLNYLSIGMVLLVAPVLAAVKINEKLMRKTDDK